MHDEENSKLENFVKGIEGQELTILKANLEEQELEELTGKIVLILPNRAVFLKQDENYKVVNFISDYEGIHSLSLFGIEIYINKSVASVYMLSDEINLNKQSDLLHQGKWLID